MAAIKEVAPSVSISDSEHQQHTKPTQRIRLLRKSNNARKGYLYACTEYGDDRFHLGFSLCHDDRFSGENNNGTGGLDMAKTRAMRNTQKDGFGISYYVKRVTYPSSYVIVPQSIVDDLERFIDYCKGVFELKPPKWADGFGLQST